MHVGGAGRSRAAGQPGTDPPQVAILDVEADGETAGRGCSVTEGISLLREARKRRLEVRMLMLSAVSAPEIISQCFDEGASGYLFRLGLGGRTRWQAIQGAGEGGSGCSPFSCCAMTSSSRPVGAAPSSVLHALTQREREVLAYVAGGADNLKIAAHLQIAERTVKSHVTQLYRKLGAENRTQLGAARLPSGRAPAAGPLTGDAPLGRERVVSKASPPRGARVAGSSPEASSHLGEAHRGRASLCSAPPSTERRRVLLRSFLIRLAASWKHWLCLGPRARARCCHGRPRAPPPPSSSRSSLPPRS